MVEKLKKIFGVTKNTSLHHAAASGSSLGLLSVIGVCGGVCSSSVIPLGAILASVGLGGLSNSLEDLRIPLLLLAVVFGYLGLRGLILRKNALGSAIFSLFLGGGVVATIYTVFFANTAVRSIPLDEIPVPFTSIEGGELKSIEGLQGLEEFRNSFNSDSDKIRFVTLLSPTCPGCMKGYEKVKKLFMENKSDKLTGHVVWLPMVKGDNLASAEDIASTLTDHRIKNYWDKDRRIGVAFTGTLGLNRTAWDIYVGFEPKSHWKKHEPPPKPKFWMHQLWGVPKHNFLDVVTLIERIEQMTEKVM